MASLLGNVVPRQGEGRFSGGSGAFGARRGAVLVEVSHPRRRPGQPRARFGMRDELERIEGDAGGVIGEHRATEQEKQELLTLFEDGAGQSRQTVHGPPSGAQRNGYETSTAVSSGNRLSAS